MIENDSNEYGMYGYLTPLCESSVCIIIRVTCEYNGSSTVHQNESSNNKVDNNFVDQSNRKILCQILQIHYFDRMSILKHKVSRTIPIVKAWTDGLISKRDALEIDNLGSYGKGKLIRLVLLIIHSE